MTLFQKRKLAKEIIQNIEEWMEITKRLGNECAFTDDILIEAQQILGQIVF